MEKKQENKDKKIKCPELQDGKQVLCLASSEGLMVPSLGELENFCLTEKYSDCPVRIRQLERDEQNLG